MCGGNASSACWDAVYHPAAFRHRHGLVERTKVGCGCWMCLNDAALGGVVLCSYAMTIIAAKIKRKRSGEDCCPAVTWVVDVFCSHPHVLSTLHWFLWSG